MTAMLQKEAVRRYCLQAGFDAVGVAAPSPQTWERYAEWIAQGYHGEMGYLSHRLPQRRDPSTVLGTEPGSLIVVAKNYYTKDPDPERGCKPVVSRYAWGEDYHRVMTLQGRRTCRWIEEQSQGDHQARWCVDTAPVLERDFAAQAGIGWVGKHTNILSRRLGNWIFLGAILTTLPLEADQPVSSHCGSCSRCLDCCPTRAFVAPYILDARKCISYLTIELRGSIPRALRPLIGARVFGCDDCLAVCPWNRFAAPSDERAFQPRGIWKTTDLIQLMRMTRDEFRFYFKNSPIQRAKYEGWKRNIAVALGNSKDPAAIPALQHALLEESPLIREHAVWALGQIGGDETKAALQSQLQTETDPTVREEIIHACRNGL